MYLKLIIILLCFSISNFVHGSTYTNYDLVPVDGASMKKIEEVISTLQLTPLTSHEGNGIPFLGINQIFINHDFSRMAFFKYDIKGDVVLNEWEITNRGRVYHYKSLGVVNAFFVSGIDEKAANAVVEKLKRIELVSFRFKFDIVSSAQADECEMKELEILNVGVFEKVSSSVVFKSLLGCAAGAKNGAYESVEYMGTRKGIGRTALAIKDVSVSAWSGLKAIGSELKDFYVNPAQKMGQYYDGVVKGTLVMKSVFTFIAEMSSNPEKAAANFRAAQGPLADNIIEMFGMLKNIPPELFVQTACSMITGIGIDVLITYFTAGVAGAKLVLTIARMKNQVSVLAKVFTALGKLHEMNKKLVVLTKEKMDLFTRRILENKIPDEDLAYIKNFLGPSAATDKTALEALQCYIK